MRNLYELAAQRLHLLLCRGAHIKGADDGAHVLGRLDRRQPRHAAPHHQDLGRVHAPRRRDLPRDEALVAGDGLDDGAVAGDVGLFGWVCVWVDVGR